MTGTSTVELVAAGLFALAICHTFCTSFFERLARTDSAHAGVWHLLGEVEIVFGFWAFILIAVLFAFQGSEPALHYIDGLSFTEPMFVFAIMVTAASRPVLQAATRATEAIAAAIPLAGAGAFYQTVLAVVPLIGSLITEPAAMTLAGLMLRHTLYRHEISNRLRYATLGVLLVNISIGGTLTPFAAPPVVMVASKWGWDLPFMLQHFGWRAAVAVLINALAATLIFRRELSSIRNESGPARRQDVPWGLVLVHLALLAGIVVFAHHPAMFMGLFLMFLGVAQAYRQHQDRLLLREGLLVGFFLAGLVMLGGLQQWWLKPLLASLNENALFWGATALTAVTDNAALTYLGSLVEGLPEGFKVALVGGAVTGGGLTIIANAPNPAGIALLRPYFKDATVQPFWMLAAALPPTLVAAALFRFF